MEKELETKKRVRTENWSAEEKDLLRELVELHLNIIENRGNDTKIIEKKNKAWKDIEEKMISSGYTRSRKQIKDQWSRLKLMAKSNIGEYKKKKKETGNKGAVEEPEERDWAIQDMIPYEFLEDDTLIDSNTTFEEFENIQPVTIDLIVESSDSIPNNPRSTSNFEASNSSSLENSSKASSNKFKKQLNKEPYTKSNPYSVLRERNLQIEAEIKQAKDLHDMKIKVQQKLLEKAELEIQILKKTEIRNEELHRLNLKKYYT